MLDVNTGWLSASCLAQWPRLPSVKPQLVWFWHYPSQICLSLSLHSYLLPFPPPTPPSCALHPLWKLRVVAGRLAARDSTTNMVSLKLWICCLFCREREFVTLHIFHSVPAYTALAHLYVAHPRNTLPLCTQYANTISFSSEVLFLPILFSSTSPPFHIDFLNKCVCIFCVCIIYV